MGPREVCGVAVMVVNSFKQDDRVAASPGLDMLDVGCGAGIATRYFAAAGCRVLVTRR
jgi:2-polyprenyl-3-methyl-5-hydroxy-6-metoxy-1,4-benzoquinol methylase